MTTPTQPVGAFPQGTHLKELLCAIADMEFQPHRWTPEHPAPPESIPSRPSARNEGVRGRATPRYFHQP
jgi:hypothetical protein